MEASEGRYGAKPEIYSTVLAGVDVADCTSGALAQRRGALLSMECRPIIIHTTMATCMQVNRYIDEMITFSNVPNELA